jgi:hypothetical protein
MTDQESGRRHGEDGDDFTNEHATSHPPPRDYHQIHARDTT